MKSFRFPALLNAITAPLFTSMLGSIALSLPIATLPTPAIAREGQFPPTTPQTTQNRAAPSPQTNAAYLEQLYSFLRDRDASTYAMATQSMSADDSIWAAQMFCQTFESGVSPADAFSAYTTSAIEQATSLGANMTEELASAVGLYGGAVMTLGSAHYCPQYQPQVQQALASFQ